MAKTKHVFGNAMVAANSYFGIRDLINGWREESPTTKGHRHDAIIAMTKMSKRDRHMQRATTSMVMKPPTQEPPVNVSTQTIEVNISCPECRRHKAMGMAKCWVGDGRNRFAIQRCRECTTTKRLGNWFRCKDNNENTISDWLQAIACFKVVKTPEVMHIELYSCETNRESQVVQTNIHITRDAASNQPSRNKSKRR